MKNWFLAFLLMPIACVFSNEAKPQKTYISPHQILVEQHGIFFIDQRGVAQPVKFLSQDANGLFMIDDYIQCLACGAWSEDGTLHKPNCPYAKK